jgi:hypothetical protein
MKKTKTTASDILRRMIDRHNFEVKLDVDGEEVVVRKWARGHACGCEDCTDACELLNINPMWWTVR